MFFCFSLVVCFPLTIYIHRFFVCLMIVSPVLSDDDDGCSNFIVDRATFGADATGLMITVCGCCMVVETGFRQLAIG